MTAQQAAEFAQVPITTFYSWINAGKLEGIVKKRFGRYKVNEAKFKKWVADNS